MLFAHHPYSIHKCHMLAIKSVGIGSNYHCELNWKEKKKIYLWKASWSVELINIFIVHILFLNLFLLFWCKI